MKRISLWLLMLLFSASLVSAQESATQQQIDKISGQIQDLLDAQALQNKRLDALEKEVGDLRDKVNTPVATDYATHAELKSLAEQMQEIDQKRKDDTENVARHIENLAKAAGAAPVTPTRHSSSATPKASETTAAATPQKGYEYEIKRGDTLGLIAKAYRDQGVKIYKKQIIAANPNINPDVLIPGTKLFIPDPSAK